jgi:hypothetical protein
MQKHMKGDLKLHSYRPRFNQELKDMDLNCKRDAWAKMIQTFKIIAKCGKVIFSDECATYQSC